MPFKQALIAIVVFAGLSGCNAGTPTAVNGADGAVRVNGAIQFGRVTVSIIGKRAIREVAGGRTDGEGRFTLDLPAGIDQPLLLEVKPAEDGRSRMICDSQGGCGDYARGEPMPVPGSFRMLALVSPQELEGQTLAVNPYTHIATHEAVRAPGLISTAGIAGARERTALSYSISNRFWQRRSSSPAKAGQLQGVALASVAAPGHRLVLDEGDLKVKAEMTRVDACHAGIADCGAVRVAKADTTPPEAVLF